jgi:hypothetical protein
VRVEYGHCNGKQMHESVLNSAVKVTKGLWVFVGHYFFFLRGLYCSDSLYKK